MYRFSIFPIMLLATAVGSRAQNVDDLEAIRQAAPADEFRSEVKVLDVFGKAATVRLEMHGWIDYLQIGRWNGEWKIINVLWELKPEVDER